MMNFPVEDFQIELENYRLGVQNILPGYLRAAYQDDALIDELALVLQSRDWLESALAVAPQYVRHHLSDIEAVDQQLLVLKDRLLAQVPLYTSFREQMPRPRSHWWYYLDKIVTETQLSAKGKQPAFWLPLAA